MRDRVSTTIRARTPVQMRIARKRSIGDHRRADDPGSDHGEDAVFRFDDNLKVYLHRDPVDFRYGMNSLSILVEQSMRLNPMDASLYIFGNRRRDRIKILGWDGSGFWLLMKRLESSRFIWPDNKAEVVTMTANVLHALLEGGDITAIRQHPKRQYLRVS